MLTHTHTQATKYSQACVNLRLCLRYTRFNFGATFTSVNENSLLSVIVFHLSLLSAFKQMPLNYATHAFSTTHYPHTSALWWSRLLVRHQKWNLFSSALVWALRVRFLWFSPCLHDTFKSFSFLNTFAAVLTLWHERRNVWSNVFVCFKNCQRICSISSVLNSLISNHFKSVNHCLKALLISSLDTR